MEPYITFTNWPVYHCHILEVSSHDYSVLLFGEKALYLHKIACALKTSLMAIHFANIYIR